MSMTANTSTSTRLQSHHSNITHSGDETYRFFVRDVIPSFGTTTGAQWGKIEIMQPEIKKSTFFLSD